MINHKYDKITELKKKYIHILAQSWMFSWRAGLQQAEGRTCPTKDVIKIQSLHPPWGIPSSFRAAFMDPNLLYKGNWFQSSISQGFWSCNTFHISRNLRHFREESMVNPRTCYPGSLYLAFEREIYKRIQNVHLGPRVARGYAMHTKYKLTSNKISIMHIMPWRTTPCIKSRVQQTSQQCQGDMRKKI